MSDDHSEQGASASAGGAPGAAADVPRYGEYAQAPPSAAAPGYEGYPPPAQPGYGAPQYAYAPGATPTGASSEQWAPPPKPGLIPLRPLGFGTLLGTPFRVLRRNAGPTFGSALIIQFVIVLITALFVGGATFFAITRVSSASAADRNSIVAGSVAIVALSTLIPLAFALVSSALLQGILVLEVSREVLGEKRRMGELWKAAAKRLWPLVLWILLQAMVAVVALSIAVGIVVLLTFIGPVGVALAVVAGILFGLGLVVLAAWLTTKLSLVSCAIVLEGLGVRAGIVRSWRLTNRSFWKTLGTEWLVNAIVYIAAQVVTQPISFIFGIVIGVVFPNGVGGSNGSGGSVNTGSIGLAVALYALVVVVQLVFGAIAAVVQAATVAVIYIDLRMRTEGLDIELVRFVEARQAGLSTPDDDPFRVSVPAGRA
ncbi:hypothetical protein [Subtercola sp. RTI3]|uniref:hypothetical protein n=1 Tax=Subtercola sp. RTI3 TaxID=3048639 RepID=UPI002B22AE9E|nr:hypothetical protein [Subtercola sp. RTI3]MEA9986696.1 hypothetical protein [Subtercola sp. RTI3]